jgi:fatty acid desaturase
MVSYIGACSWTNWRGHWATICSREVSLPEQSLHHGMVGELGAGPLWRRFSVGFVSLVDPRATLFCFITTLADVRSLRLLWVACSAHPHMVCRGPWRWIIHPRNNGYHLTHHLLPAVPYYRLPEAHTLLCQLPMLEDRSHICRAYFTTQTAVTTEWQSRAVA